MLNSSFAKNIIISGIISFVSSQAHALCSAPEAEFPTDLIIQLSSSNGQAMIGTVESIGASSNTARSKGAMFFDSESGGVLMCNGTDWIAPFSAQTSGTNERIAAFYGDAIRSEYVGHRYGGSYTSDLRHLPEGLPVDTIGDGEWKFTIYARGHRCNLNLVMADGSNKYIGRAYSRSDLGERSNQTGYYATASTFNVAKKSDGTYQWRISGTSIQDDMSGPWTGRLNASDRCYDVGWKNVERLN